MHVLIARSLYTSSVQYTTYTLSVYYLYSYNGQSVLVVHVLSDCPQLKNYQSCKHAQFYSILNDIAFKKTPN